jgi:hypothetical protein
MLLAAVACGAPFDRARWTSGAGDECKADNPRPGMITAAEHAGMRYGAPRDDIRRLLGEPDGETASSDSYGLGLEPRGADCMRMVIAYDADDLVDTITFARAIQP